MSRNAPSPEFGYIKKTGFLSFSYDFMCDRIMCVLVRIKVRGHFVMSIIQFLNFISVHFWTYLPQTRTGDDRRKFLFHVSEERGRFVFFA